MTFLFNPDSTMGTDEAAEYLGVGKSTLRKSRHSGLLRGIDAPRHTLERCNGRVRKVVAYRKCDLDDWADSFRKPIPSLVQNSMRFAAMRDEDPPLYVAVMPRTVLRANLYATLGIVWRHRWLDDDDDDKKALLMAMLPQNCGADAMHCHLVDSDNQSEGAEELVRRVWRIMRSDKASFQR